MKHRKFVKQLMAQGYQRNTAEVMAMCARAAGRTYEEYLSDEIRRQSVAEAILNVQITLVDHMRHVCEAAAKIIDRLREGFASFNLDTVTTMLDLVNENAPQIAEQHAADALYALAYSYGVDLANGPDMTGHGGGGND